MFDRCFARVANHRVQAYSARLGEIANSQAFGNGGSNHDLSELVPGVVEGEHCFFGRSSLPKGRNRHERLSHAGSTVDLLESLRENGLIDEDPLAQHLVRPDQLLNGRSYIDGRIGHTPILATDPVDVVNSRGSLQKAQAPKVLGSPYSPKAGPWMRLLTQTSSGPYSFLMVS